MSLSLWPVRMPFHCQHSLLHNCPSQWLCLRFSLIVKVQLYRCVYYIRENPVSQYLPVYKYRVGVSLRYLTPYTVEHALSPVSPPVQSSDQILESAGPVEKRWGRRVNDACPHWWQQVCRDFLAFRSVSTCLFHSPQLLDFPRIWCKLIVCWSDEGKLVESEEWLIVFINVHQTFLS